MLKDTLEDTIELTDYQVGDLWPVTVKVDYEYNGLGVLVSSGKFRVDNNIWLDIPAAVLEDVKIAAQDQILDMLEGDDND